MKVFLIAPLAVIIGLFACQKETTTKTELTVYKATGSINARLDEFKAALGTNNTTPGAVGGRREINWEGVPDSLLDKPLAGNFFNPVGSTALASLQRGLVYDDDGFEVSATNFSRIDSEAATELKPFSGSKTFANVSRAEWPVGFQVAGKTDPASVKAFGMVFSDVDVEGSVTLEFFDGGKSLGKFSPPAHDATTPFSFLGVQFTNRSITKVKVSHSGILSDGQKDISQGGAKDLIVIDDLIYSEPVKQ